MEIHPGEIVGILGKNGTGKSTLLRMIAGLSSHDQGKIELRSQQINSNNLSPRKSILYLGHSPGLYPALTAVENLAFAGRIYQKQPDLIEMENIFRQVGLEQQCHDPIKIYSQGMLQRLKLALAIWLPWEVLLFDEPFSGLDLQGRRLTERILKEWVSQNKTMVLVVHDLDWAQKFCSRIIFLDKGLIALDQISDAGNASEIQTMYSSLMA